jgi:hypothetical protein
LNESLGGDGSVAEGECCVGSELDGHDKRISRINPEDNWRNPFIP